MGDFRRAEAVEVVARSVMNHRLVAPHQPVTHDDYSELSDDQWKAVEAWIKRTAEGLCPPVEEFEAAYEFLSNL